MEHARLVMQRLSEHRLYAKQSKCDFVKTELSFLRHIVSADGLNVDPKKVAAVQHWPTPSDIGQVQAILGLGNYFRNFIQGYNNLVHPLNDLLRKEAKFDWNERCTRAFEGLKHVLYAPMLTLPDFAADAPGFEVWCDASAYGIGAILMQRDKVIAYEARSLTPAERNYTTGEQELLAVVHAMRTWRCYLEGDKGVKIMTDHAPNTYLPTQTTLSRRQARWSQFLQRFPTLSWWYKPGKVNVADPVSRDPNLLADCAAAPAGLPPVCDARQQHDGTAHAAGSWVLAAAPAETCSTAAIALAAVGRARLLPKSSMDVADATSLLDRIRNGYATDEYFADGDADADVLNEQRDRLWYRGDAVMVPADDRLLDDILYEAHHAAASVHFGVRATLKRLEGKYFWSHGSKSMTEHVDAYVRSCESCQRNKASNQRPGGVLQPMPVPPWPSVSVDFVTGMPVSDLGCDSILGYVDRFTKMVHLVPTRKDLTALNCAQLMFNAVFKLHGLPDDIVSDCDKLFTSHFWRELC
jgi:RNase H-like domain found in reverse transcriptase/Integrase zinc binding domain